MKQLIPLLLCLLLCGCARQTPPAQQETLPEPTATAAAAGLYDPEHPIEEKYPRLARAYPLTLQKTHGLLALGKDILVLSGQDKTTMTVFAGEDLKEAAVLTLDFPLQQDDPSLQVHENSLSFFDPVRRETILLDHRLREIRRIAVPDGLTGKPILSPGNILYYATEWSVMAWDLESGIRRTVKELSYEAQELTALHLESKILECRIRDSDHTAQLLLDADRGLELFTLPEDTRLRTREDRFFAVHSSGYQTLMLFGSAGESPELLLPEAVWEQQFYLPEDHAAVTVCPSAEETRLNYYELNTGILRSSLSLGPQQTPKSIVNSTDHFIYILAYDPASDGDLLYRWDVLRQPPDPGNVTSWKTDYHSSDEPDLEALEACREYAGAIGQKYGITVRIGADATVVQPWDYQFAPEYLAPVLEQELKLLDKRLAQYPESLLNQTREHFAGLTICLVRQITGTGDNGSLSNATGIQFFEDNQAYVVVTTGKHSEQALYHELYHVMETHILTESTALDQWEALNPAGFSYGTGDRQDADVYLQGQTRAFVDRYSMLSLKEDRARILENAILQERESLFRSEYMQRKLTALCIGIREAYRLKSHPEALPWEQYLVTPLTPEV